MTAYKSQLKFIEICKALNMHQYIECIVTRDLYQGFALKM